MGKEGLERFNDAPKMMINNSHIRCAMMAAISFAMSCGCALAVDVADGEILAQRFRPYYKFSADPGVEVYRPCSWQWFAAHSDLYRDKCCLATAAELNKDPEKLLTFPNADIRTTTDPTGPLVLHPDRKSWGGEPWQAVMQDGDGLYAQVEDAGNDFVVLTYWTLFAFNKTKLTGDHEGDIIAVSVVYDRRTDQLVRATFGMHGKIVESFNLLATKREDIEDLKGRDPARRQATISTRHITVDQSYEDGPWWYAPSRPELYLAQEPKAKQYEHLVIFCEWGSHEPWPNSSGSAALSPGHPGDDVSFLPARVIYLGSFTRPVDSQAPIVFFNGRWGSNPMGLLFHRSCFYPEERKNNRFKIPGRAFADRDFFDAAAGWPLHR